MTMLNRAGRGPLLALALIFALGIFLRVTVLQNSLVPEPVRGDAVLYFNYSVNLITEELYSRDIPALFLGGHPAPDAVIPPGYPLFVMAFLGNEWQSGVVSGVNQSITPVLLAQTLVSSLTILFVYLIARRFLDAGLALVPAALVAVSPHLINANIYLLTESWFTTLFWLGMLLLAYGTLPQDRPGWLLAGGALMAAAALTRPTVQYLPLLLLLCFLPRAPANWRRWGGMLAIFVLILGAWGVRNLISTGAFSDPTSLTNTILHGSYPNFMFNQMPVSLGIPYQYDPAVRVDITLHESIASILQRISQAPGDYLKWYAIGKPLAFFRWDLVPLGITDGRLLTYGDIFLFPTPVTPYADQFLAKATYLLSYVLYRPLLVLALLAALLVWLPACRTFWGERLPLLQLLSLTLIYVIGIHIIGAPFPRYSIPFQPLLYLLTCGMASAAWQYWRSRARPL